MKEIEKPKYEYKKTHLEYQITEYDCGTVSVLNALRYLFNRDEIVPEIYKHIINFTLDQNDKKGEEGKGGTSPKALEELCDWINHNAPSKGMNIVCKSLPKEECYIYNKQLEETIKNGGVAILRVWQKTEHYCLLTKLDEDYAYIFDPYYFDIKYYDNDDACEIIKDKTFEYNRKVLKSRIEEESENDFALVRGENQQIILIMRG